MSESRVSLRQVQVALWVAISWQLVLLVIASQQGWRAVEYGVWITPIAALFVVLELILYGVDSAFEENTDVRSDLQALRLRSSVVVYLAATVAFTRITLCVAAAYAILRVCVAPFHDRRGAWMSVDVALLMGALVCLALGELDPFQFASVLTVMVTVVTVAIYQDDTTTERST